MERGLGAGPAVQPTSSITSVNPSMRLFDVEKTQNCLHQAGFLIDRLSAVLAKGQSLTMGSSLNSGVYEGISSFGSRFQRSIARTFDGMLDFTASVAEVFSSCRDACRIVDYFQSQEDK